MTTYIDRITPFGSYYHAGLRCGHTLVVTRQQLDERQLFIGKRFDCGQCGKRQK